MLNIESKNTVHVLTVGLYAGCVCVRVWHGCVACSEGDVLH